MGMSMLTVLFKLNMCTPVASVSAHARESDSNAPATDGAFRHALCQRPD